MSGQVGVNLLSSVSEDEIQDVATCYNCILTFEPNVPRDKDGSIGPQVTGTLTCEVEDDYVAFQNIKACLEEFDMIMKRL